MKTKHIILLFLCLFVVAIMPSFSFASFNDVEEDNIYRNSIEKMVGLNILKGVGNNEFAPKDTLTREQFAVILIKALDLEDNARANTGKSIFGDIELDRWSVGFINEAYKNNLITGMSDGLFYPELDVNFAQVCTVLVKALGYSDSDTRGNWPNNYIEKAKNLKITKDLDLSGKDPLKREEIAYILDNFFQTNMKGLTNTFAEVNNVYINELIVGNSITNETLLKNQVMTTGGILDVDQGIGLLNIGERYNLVIEDDVIVNAVSSMEKVKKITVLSYTDGKITFYDSTGQGSMSLIEKTRYYYKGVEKDFSEVETLLKRNSVIIFVYNENGISIDSATIVDPIYSAPQIVDNNISLTGMIGGLNLNKLQIIKEGKVLEIEDIENRDVIYKIDDYFKENSYYLVVDSRVQGELTDILPNKLSPECLEIDHVKYYLSKYMNVEKITASSDSFMVKDDICAILGYDGKVIDVMEKGIKNGPYQKLRILGDYKSIDTFAENQVLTEAGIYYVADNLPKLELGSKYEMIIDNDTIVKIGDVFKSQRNITVRNTDGKKITYNNGSVMLLPEKTIYYYKGEIINANSVVSLLKYNTSIIFVYNETGTGYEYAIVVDPIYSKPEVVMGFDPYRNGEIGDIEFSRDIPVIIGDRTTDIYDIENYTVAYKVSNYWDENAYLLIIDDSVYGTIQQFLPTRLNVTSIKLRIGSVYQTYELSEYFDINKITEGGTLNSYTIGRATNLYLGRDGKIVYMN